MSNVRIINSPDRAYRQGNRSDAQFQKDLEIGNSIQAELTKFLWERIQEIPQAKMSEVAVNAVNNDADVRFSVGTKKLKIEIQTSYALYKGYEPGEKFYSLGPLVHVKEHKIKQLLEFEKTSSNRGYLLHVILHKELAGFYLFRVSEMKLNWGTCKPMENKACYAIPHTDFTSKHSLVQNIEGMIAWLRGSP